MIKEKLTPKRAAFIKAKLDNPGISHRKAAQIAGYANATIVSGKVYKGCAGTLKEAMEAAGITKTKLAKRLNETLDATKRTYEKGKQKEVPDHMIRLKAIELSAKIGGDLVERVEEIKTYGDMTPDEIKDLAKKVKEIDD